MEHSATGDLEKELIDMKSKLAKLKKTCDEAFLRHVLADDLIFRRASGKVVNKKEYLAELQDSANTYDYLISEDVRPILYEGIALVSISGESKEKARD
jgi:hypothetical protein